MTRSTDPHALDCAARSMERAGAILLRKLQRGTTSLDAIARTAPLLGALGTALGLVDGLKTFSSNWCPGGACAGGISECFVLFILSMPVAIFACGAFFYLRHRVAVFEFEIHTQTLEVLNGLARLSPGRYVPVG